jgi:hypothetical protein
MENGRLLIQWVGIHGCHLKAKYLTLYSIAMVRLATIYGLVVGHKKSGDPRAQALQALNRLLWADGLMMILLPQALPVTLFAHTKVAVVALQVRQMWPMELMALLATNTIKLAT